MTVVSQGRVRHFVTPGTQAARKLMAQTSKLPVLDESPEAKKKREELARWNAKVQAEDKKKKEAVHGRPVKPHRSGGGA